MRALYEHDRSWDCKGRMRASSYNREIVMALTHPTREYQRKQVMNHLKEISVKIFHTFEGLGWVYVPRVWLDTSRHPGLGP